MTIKMSNGVRDLFSAQGIEHLEQSLAMAEQIAACLGADMPELWNYEADADGFTARLHAWLPLPGQGEHIVFSPSFTLSARNAPGIGKRARCRFVIVGGTLSTVQEHPLPDGP